MKLIIGFAILAFSQASHTNRSCDDVIVHNVHYEKEILIDNKDSVSQLAIDYNSNTLFFSYFNQSIKGVFSLVFLDLKTKKYNTIPGINNGCANTVDNKKYIVYLGAEDGIYQFDYKTKRATHIEGTHDNIWQMFFKNNVYYSTYPDEKAYVYKDGKVDIAPELANTTATLVALNNDLDFYFTNETSLYKLTKSSGNTLLLGYYDVNGMTSDIDGNLYFSTPDGIYSIDENDQINNIASIPDTFGVAIESNGNIIYASRNEIIRLKPTKSPCSVDKKNLDD